MVISNCAAASLRTKYCIQMKFMPWPMAEPRTPKVTLQMMNISWRVSLVRQRLAISRKMMRVTQTAGVPNCWPSISHMNMEPGNTTSAAKSAASTALMPNPSANSVGLALLFAYL